MRRLRSAGGGLVLALAVAQPGVGQTPLLLDTLHVAVDSRLASGAGAVQVLDAEELAALPVRSVEEALRWGLGIDLQRRSAAQADLSIRGSTFEQVLVLVDGVRMSDPQTGHFDLDLTVPLDRVERIEILRGPASAVHGADAVGGVVNVVTKDGRGLETTTGVTRVEGGSNKHWSASLDATVPLGAWRLGTGGGFESSDGHRDGTDYRISRASGRLVGPAAGGRAFVEVGHARRKFGADAFYAPYPSYEETRTTTASARWVGRLTGSLVLEPRVSHRVHEDDFILRREDPAFYRNLHDSRQTSGQLLARLPLGGSGALAVGGEWTREALESTNLGDREQDLRAGFAEAVFRVGTAQVQGGVRYDDRDDVGGFASPSASLRWEEGPLGLHASWGRTFRAPTWTERYYQDPANVGTPDLSVERGWAVDVGGELRREERLLAVRAFHRVTKDLIDWARPVEADASVPWETRNVRRATVRGLEAELEGVRWSGITWGVSGTWLTLDAVDAEGFLSKYALRPVHRELLVKGRLDLPDGSWVQAAAADRARVGGGGGLTLDVRLDFPVGQARGYLDVLNLTDAGYPDVTGLPVPGRSFVAGVRTPFGGRRDAPR
ncbi:MAG: TonB-dependent receptor [Gemmatimonadales bacterium]|nr:MAG: TonB-dependent receptor [Gemmatimonadales bacterium]